MSLFLSKASFEFTQDGNTLGTTEECESLTVRLEYQLPDDPKDCFVVLETKGWSINDGQELKELIERCIEGAVHATRGKTQGSISR